MWHLISPPLEAAIEPDFALSLSAEISLPLDEIKLAVLQIPAILISAPLDVVALMVVDEALSTLISLPDDASR